MQHTRQMHANTTRHAEPADAWPPIGSHIRALVENAAAKQRTRDRLCVEFCDDAAAFDDDEAEFIATYTRFGG